VGSYETRDRPRDIAPRIHVHVTSAAFTRIVATLVFLSVCGATTRAQGPNNAAIVATNSCRDPFATRVLLKYVPNAENALMLNGSPMILLDANVINREPLAAAEFLYLPLQDFEWVG
jgi:hypothetical protein